MEVFLASGNPHKFGEFVEILTKSGLKINFHSAEVFGGMPEVDESGLTFMENALIKAEALEQLLPANGWALADDSGLVVDALAGRPGVHSARYAGPGANATANNIKLLNELHGFPEEKRTARFQCVLCFKQKGAPPHFFTGTCEGHILMAPAGDMGFGYDPLFQPIGYQGSFAELGSDCKNSLSHRGRAISEWAQYLDGPG